MSHWLFTLQLSLPDSTRHLPFSTRRGSRRAAARLLRPWPQAAAAQSTARCCCSSAAAAPQGGELEDGDRLLQGREGPGRGMRLESAAEGLGGDVASHRGGGGLEAGCEERHMHEDRSGQLKGR